jgi:hypothetical protein
MYTAREIQRCVFTGEVGMYTVSGKRQRSTPVVWEETHLNTIDGRIQDLILELEGQYITYSITLVPGTDNDAAGHSTSIREPKSSPCSRG